MTPKQQALYWREWAKVRAIDPAMDRHALHTQALGKAKSSKAFTNADLDKVLAAFRAVSEPHNLNAQVRQLEQPKKRQLYAIREHLQELAALDVGNPLEYARSIVADQHPGLERLIEDLSASKEVHMSQTGLLIEDSELEKLRFTLARCVSRLRQAADISTFELSHRVKEMQMTGRNPVQSRSLRPVTAEARSKRQTLEEQAEAQGIDCPF
ncbi:MAG TPA: hypothetical protein VEH27_13925 [Methylomirabilota bacterium]|nr:hypothetical protein [Methylomirabilota bacterium]